MGRVPITVMGFRCERCGHEWIPKKDHAPDPAVCPKCHSAYWNRPKKRSMMDYEDFRNQIEKVLREAGGSLTWTEIRTKAKLPQMFPNNQWVHRIEKDIGLERTKDAHGIIHWQLKMS
jgi:DNA-directed RNA polymerase subunit RPC12/RpoP